MIMENFFNDPRVHSIAVLSRPATFRRCGREFNSQNQTFIKLDELTEDELTQLVNEPNLQVFPVGTAVEEADEKEKQHEENEEGQNPPPQNPPGGHDETPDPPPVLPETVLPDEKTPGETDQPPAGESDKTDAKTPAKKQANAADKKGAK